MTAIHRNLGIAATLFAGLAATPLVAHPYGSTAPSYVISALAEVDDSLGYDTLGFDYSTVPAGGSGASSFPNASFNAAASSSMGGGKLAAAAALAGARNFPLPSDPDYQYRYGQAFEAAASARAYEIISPPQSVRFTANAYFAATVGVTYERDPASAVIQLDRHLSDPWNDQVVGGTSAVARFVTGYYDVNADSYSGFSVIQQAVIGEFVVADGNPVGSINISSTGYVTSETLVVDNGIMADRLTEWQDFDPLAGPISQPGRNYTYEVELLAGRTYRFVMELDCSAYLGMGSQFARGNSATCNAANSAYWNGMTNVTDLFGNPISNFNLISDSGFNYRYASPLSPAPANAPPTAVPEPATWAMLIAGFGLVGGTARRRRFAPAKAE